MKYRLLPVGGLGNRLRVIKSALNFIGNESLLLYSIPTKFFPVHFDDVFNLPPNVQIVKINTPILFKEKALTVCARLCYLFASRKFSKYQNRKFDDHKILITPHALEVDEPKASITTSQILKLQNYEKDEYNAVHIRRGDNKVAIENNDLSKFEEFIQKSYKKVYIASDCLETKNYFLKKYPDKVFSKNLNLDRKSRQSFFDSILEIQYLVAADQFLPSNKSSFSSTIMEYRCS